MYVPPQTGSEGYVPPRRPGQMGMYPPHTGSEGYVCPTERTREVGTPHTGSDGYVPPTDRHRGVGTPQTGSEGWVPPTCRDRGVGAPQGQRGMYPHRQGQRGGDTHTKMVQGQWGMYCTPHMAKGMGTPPMRGHGWQLID